MSDVAALLPVAAFLVAAIAAMSARRSSLAALAGGTAAAWLLAPAVPGLVFLHRPLGLHAVLASASVARPDRPALAVLAVTWASALVVPLGSSPLVMLAVGAVVGVEAARRSRRTEGTRAARAMVPGLVALAVCWTGTATARLLALDVGTAAVVYGALFGSAGVALAAAVLQAQWSEDIDDAVELGGRAPEETVERLRAEGLRRGDAAGAVVLQEAADLLATNARLTHALRDSADEVRLSRRRLLEAAMEERRRLERVLAEGAGRRLCELRDTLVELDRCLAGAGSAAPEGTPGLAATSLAELARTVEDIDQIARGLHPRVLTEHGLAGALADLSARTALPVRWHAPRCRLPEQVEVAVWYAIAEAVGNAVKHAGATTVAIDVSVHSDRVLVAIDDDGVGGASLVAGGGLAGVADRLDSLAGRLEVLPIAEGGTRVHLEVPLL